MKSLDELTEMHKNIWLDCYNYATGRFNHDALRGTLRSLVWYALEEQLSASLYDFEVLCDETNNPPELRARGGYHVDVKIVERQGLKRTFNMPIDAPPPTIMSLSGSQQDHS